jgi:hypothetical protein
LHYMKRLNIFLQDWAFGHRVAFKRLLRPFISAAGLHKRGVRSLGDVQWGAWLPYTRPALSSHSLGGALVLRTTAPYTQASLGRRSNLGWLWLVKREREREREVR